MTHLVPGDARPPPPEAAGWLQSRSLGGFSGLNGLSRKRGECQPAIWQYESTWTEKRYEYSKVYEEFGQWVEICGGVSDRPPNAARSPLGGKRPKGAPPHLTFRWKRRRKHLAQPTTLADKQRTCFSETRCVRNKFIIFLFDCKRAASSHN